MEAKELEAILDHAEEAYLISCRDDHNKPDLFATNSSGDTLLHVAVGQKQTEAVRYLVDHGLDVNARGDYCATPLFQASANRDAAMVELLLKLGADPDIPDHRGDLPSKYW